jgi:hypothetical protein
MLNPWSAGPLNGCGEAEIEDGTDPGNQRGVLQCGLCSWRDLACSPDSTSPGTPIIPSDRPASSFATPFDTYLLHGRLSKSAEDREPLRETC